jgi:hypothetical protein
MGLAGKASKTIKLRGSPTMLAAVFRPTHTTPGTLPVSLDLPESVIQEAPLLAQVSPIGDKGAAAVQLQLPRSTPPGTYRGTVQVGDREHPIVVDVEPRTRLRIYPKRTSMQAHPGEKVSLDLNLVNEGNISCEVPRVSAFGLFEKHGLDRAIGYAFRAELETGERRIDRIVEEARKGHGGVVKLQIQKGAGELKPGDVCDLHGVLHIPDQVRPGRFYWGTWSLYNLNYKIEITTPDVKSTKKV